MLNSHEQKIFDDFLKASQEKLPNINLFDYYSTLEKEFYQVDTTLQKWVDFISKAPFLAVFDLWIKKYGCTNGMLLDAAKTLLKHDFIKTTDDQGKIWTTDKAREFDHSKVLNEIRNQQNWSIRRKENLVQTYISFISWLSIESRGYIARVVDPDQLRVSKRAFKFENFIEFLDAITSEKSQLIAKLLYFGKKQTLEDVIGLKLEQVDFTKNIITYNSDSIQYPQHIFSDINTITFPRKTGYIFESSRATKINQKTVFRNFQDAAERIGIKTSFSLKTLTLSD